MCGYSQDWCDPSTETDCYEDGVWIASAWMGCVWTVDVGMGDMWMGRRGEPSTTNCPINNIAVDVTAMEAMS
ncbi:hypothetical protein F2Q69_00023092 [Brassica cretica]|uniref:Uncharacterized protein n=1 Tax=Brassica cretica TaxID=69181 RepID=A0A8S9QDK3_BRACR|nr:hypothetical protein F2Q69_00023092 [Brassica cretica]